MAASCGAAQHTPHRTGRRFIWLCAPVVFLAGLLVGGVLVAVFSNGTTVRRPHDDRHPTGGARRRARDQLRRCVHPGGTRCTGRVRAARPRPDAFRRLDASAPDGIMQQLTETRRHVATELADCRASTQRGNKPAPSR